MTSSHNLDIKSITRRQRLWNVTESARIWVNTTDFQESRVKRRIMKNLCTTAPTKIVMSTTQHCSDWSVPTIVFPDGSILTESDWEDLKAKFQAS